MVTLAISTAMLAASQGNTTERPGELTKGRMFIENRGAEQAIPVVFQSDASTPPVPVTFRRQVWEYRTVMLTAGQDAAAALTAVGAEGWETTGLQVTDGTRIAVLLKRPR
jgi:hypothetical protein